MKRLLVFTDLDGSLLRHEDYDWQDARPALDKLAARHCPVILNSSKTHAELLPLSRELGLCHPLVCENGAVVAIPSGYFDDVDTGQLTEADFQITRFSTAYSEVTATLRSIRRQYGFRFSGFQDWSTEDVMSRTGLDREHADAARQRQCSEPLLWKDSDEALDRFRNELTRAGLVLTRGGRFFHVMGPTDKGQAVNWLATQYRQHWPDINWLTVGLGDSNNDLPMLKAVDYPVLIPNPHSSAALQTTGLSCLKPKQEGPAGWNEAIAELIDKIL